MPKTRLAKPRHRPEEEVLDQGIQQLLRATKEATAKSGKPLARGELRKQGYSERFIDKVENA